MSTNTVRWISLILGVLVLICGISLFFTPLEAYLMIAIFVPFAILFSGINSIVNYFGNKEARQHSGWVLADGIIGIIIGVWLLSRPGVAAASLPYVFAFWVLFAGTLRIIGSISAKKVMKGWIWLLMLGILGVLSGIFLLNHPLFSALMVSYMVAWCFIVSGIHGIAYFFLNKGGGAAAA